MNQDLYGLTPGQNFLQYRNLNVKSEFSESRLIAKNKGAEKASEKPREKATAGNKFIEKLRKDSDGNINLDATKDKLKDADTAIDRLKKLVEKLGYKKDSKEKAAIIKVLHEQIYSNSKKDELSNFYIVNDELRLRCPDSTTGNWDDLGEIELDDLAEEIDSELNKPEEEVAKDTAEAVTKVEGKTEAKNEPIRETIYNFFVSLVPGGEAALKGFAVQVAEEVIAKAGDEATVKANEKTKKTKIEARDGELEVEIETKGGKKVEAEVDLAEVVSEDKKTKDSAKEKAESRNGRASIKEQLDILVTPQLAEKARKSVESLNDNLKEKPEVVNEFLFLLARSIRSGETFTAAEREKVAYELVGISGVRDPEKINKVIDEIDAIFHDKLMPSKRERKAQKTELRKQASDIVAEYGTRDSEISAEVRAEPTASMEEKIKTDKDFLDALYGRSAYRITTGEQMKVNFRQLGIDPAEFADYSIGSGFARAVDRSWDAEQIHRFSSMNNVYETPGDVYETHARLSDLQNPNEAQQKKLDMLTAYIVASHQLLEAYENARVVENNAVAYHPDKISEFSVSRSVERAFGDDIAEPEILGAIMIYHYGLDEAVSRGLIEYVQINNRNETPEYELVINSIPREDEDQIFDAYEIIAEEESGWDVFRSENLTEGMQDFYNHPEFNEIAAELSAHKFEQIGQNGTNDQIVIAHLRHIFNPEHRGVVSEDYETLSDEELEFAREDGVDTYDSKYTKDNRSGVAAYVDVLDRVIDRTQSDPEKIYSLQKLAIELRRLAEVGQLHLENKSEINPDADRLSRLPIPSEEATIHALRTRGIDQDYVELIRAGYSADKQIKETDDMIAYAGRDNIDRVFGPVYAECTDYLALGFYADLKAEERADILAGLGYAITIQTAAGEYKTHFFRFTAGVGAYADINNTIRNNGWENQVGFVLSGGYEYGPSGTAIEGSVGLTLGLIPSVRVGARQNLGGSFYVAGGITWVGPFTLPDVGAGFSLRKQVTARENAKLEDANLSIEDLGHYDELDHEDRVDVASELASIRALISVARDSRVYEIAAEKPGSRFRNPETGEIDQSLIEAEYDQLAIRLFNLYREAIREVALNESVEEGDFGIDFRLVLTPVGIIPVISFEFHDEQFVSYDLNYSDAALENVRIHSVSAQIAEQTGVNPNRVWEMNSGKLILTEDGWKLHNTTYQPELDSVFGHSTEELHEQYSPQGLHVTEIPKDMEGGQEYRERGYKLFTIDTNMFPYYNLNLVFDEHLDGKLGVAVLTDEPTADGKLHFAINTNSAKNLHMHGFEHRRASGAPEKTFFFTDRSLDYDEIELQGADYITYRNGQVNVESDTNVISNQPQNFAFADTLTNMDAKVEAGKEVTKAIIANQDLLRGLEATEAKELTDFVQKVLGKNKAKLKRFAELSTANNRTNWEQPDKGPLVKFLKEEYKKANPDKPELTGVRLAFVIETTIDATLTQINKYGQTELKRYKGKEVPDKVQKRIEKVRRKKAEQRINKITDRFLRQALAKNPNLKERFTAAEKKEIRETIVASLKKAAQEADGFVKVPEVGTEKLPDGYAYTTTAAASILGNKVSGNRYGATDNLPESSLTEIVEGSLQEFGPETLVGQFLLELLDPIDVKDPEKLFKSRLGTRILGLPLGKKNGETVYAISEIIESYGAKNQGAAFTEIYAELSTLSGEALTKAFREPKNKAAIEAFGRFMTDVREAQINQTELSYNLSNGSAIKLNFDTKAATFLMGKCANGSNGIKQDIILRYFEEGELITTTTTTANSYNTRSHYTTDSFSAAVRPDFNRPNVPKKEAIQNPEGQEGTARDLFE